MIDIPKYWQGRTELESLAGILAEAQTCRGGPAWATPTHHNYNWPTKGITAV